MMKLLVLLLVFSGMICSEGDQGSREPPGPLEPTCEMYTDMEFSVTEGEALRIIPDSLKNSIWTDSQHNLFTWHCQSKQGNTSFSDKEEERIHHHGPALLFLPLFLNDSGLYIAQLNFLGKCHTFHVPIRVVSASVPLGKHRLYTPILASDSNVKIPCPEQVADLCKDLKGRLHWFNNSTLRNGENLPDLQLQGPFKTDDIYTCTCTWEHNNKIYNSTASRKLQISEKPAFQEIQIIHPTTTELTVHPGSPQEIKCVAFFGTNIEAGYEVWWEKNNYSVSGLEGYNQTFSRELEEPSKKSFFSSTLTINKVQASDLHTSFTCRASHHVETRSHTLHLKPAQSQPYLGVALVCAGIVFLLAATKYFAVDLVLFSRRFLRCTKAHNDGSRYDVYVVYHPQKESKAIQNQFLSQALPLVLEQKCGYRVFIHGRDDISREDRLEQVKERMRLSRRLMVVLTPGLEVNETLGSSSSSPAVVDFDWQLGLHQTMVQEMRVILVQLGEVGPQGNTHLPAPLQHLVHKRVPLYWQEDSPGAAHWNSHFWKRVRYAMPSATTKQSSSVV
ncbi:Interleukin-1 receptor-like 1 [Merluccius polli]|uniref:Interleukin-1 receptor-like 1 n=1 Tax=Merluccius polli TaxID=89951 RepID=A0AA47MHH3_MERPO|nr:Interleukin-1 receptor-like 1 [Merluccius polli]